MACAVGFREGGARRRAFVSQSFPHHCQRALPRPAGARRLLRFSRVVVCVCPARRFAFFAGQGIPPDTRARRGFRHSASAPAPNRPEARTSSTFSSIFLSGLPYGFVQNAVKQYRAGKIFCAKGRFLDANQRIVDKKTGQCYNKPCALTGGYLCPYPFFDSCTGDLRVFCI